MCTDDVSTRVILCLALPGIGLGCATNTAPSGWLPRAPEAARDAYGGWAELNGDGGNRVQGELIALNADSIYVLTQNGLAALPMAGIQSLKVTGYDPRTGELRLWALGGTLGTLSHGWFLIISAPLWIVTSSIALGAHSHTAQEAYPDTALDELRKYARFPQGLPAGIDRASLKARR